ncbi:MAG: type II toxin-antitoxin system VapC family toxin [Thermoleophilia bacterium]|nr:type II toxin-antitoxin system VapC family toxin [Thermoleophilia bacterium]
MKEWLVDTNVILDVLGADPEFGDRSRLVLEETAETGTLVVNPVIFAEVGAFVDSIEELDELVPESLFRRDAIPWTAAFLAGRAFNAYRRAGGPRERMLADFMIGAHAAVAGFSLITRDRGYGRYFRIEVLDPADFTPLSPYEEVLCWRLSEALS